MPHVFDAVVLFTTIVVTPAWPNPVFLGWGLLSQFLPFRSVMFPISQHCQNKRQLLHITSIFDRCHRSLAVIRYPLRSLQLPQNMILFKPDRKCETCNLWLIHDDVIKWKHFPRHFPFVKGIHRSPANSPHEGQWHRALMFSLICAWTNGWANHRNAGDLRYHRMRYYCNESRKN